MFRRVFSVLILLIFAAIACSPFSAPQDDGEAPAADTDAPPESAEDSDETSPEDEPIQQPAAEEVRPVLALVIDRSGSMNEPVFPENIPDELAELVAQLDEIETRPDYILIQNELDALFDSEEYQSAQFEWYDAVEAREQWLFDNGHADAQRQVLELLEEGDCSDRSYSIVIASNADNRDRWIDIACRDGSIKEGDADYRAIQRLTDYVEDEEWQPLNEAVDEGEERLIELQAELGIDQLQGELADFRERYGYNDIEDELDEQVEDLGIDDRMSLARTGAQALLNLSRLDDIANNRETEIALVRFSTAAVLEQPLTTDEEAISERIDLLIAGGGTNIGSGLEIALDEIEASGDPDQPTMIILLSDGETNTGLTREEILARIPDRANESNTVICTIGLGNDENEALLDIELLEDLAYNTGGEFLLATSGEDLLAFFVACRQNLLSDQFNQFTGSVTGGDSVDVGEVAVLENVERLTFTLNYLTGEPILQIRTPDGEVLDASSAQVSVAQEENVQLVTIEEPEAGDWAIEVEGEGEADDETIFSVTAGQELLEAVDFDDENALSVAPLSPLQIGLRVVLGLGIAAGLLFALVTGVFGFGLGSGVSALAGLHERVQNAERLPSILRTAAIVFGVVAVLSIVLMATTLSSRRSSVQTTYANATATRSAFDTALADQQATSTAFVTGTAQANAERVAGRTATAEADAAALAELEATATANMASTLIYLDGLLPDLLGGRSLVGPWQGQFAHQPDDGFIEQVNTGLFVENFVARAIFSVPYAPADGSWDAGFTFRSGGELSQYRIFITSEGNWALVVYNGGENGRTIKSGVAPGLSTGADDTNELILVADGETGHFYVNGTAVGAFPLSARTEPGNISAAIELQGGAGFEDGVTRYEGFQVRELP